MGFGLLFVGYIFLAYSISFADLLGYLVMIAAAKKLSSYIDGFSRTRRILYALAAVALLNSGAALCTLIFSADTVLKVTATVENAAAVLDILLSVLFYVFMLRAIADIAKEVELPKVERWARINLVLSVIACLSGFLNLISTPVGADGEADPVLAVIFGAVPIAVNVLIVILNAALIYTCYMRICLPSEQDITLPPKEKETKKRALPFHRPLDEDEAEVERLFEEKQAAEQRERAERKKKKRR